MNAFADWLFSILLGWTGNVANRFWNILVNNQGGISGFLSRYWLGIVLVLLIAGTVIDYVVWFFRWRPHYVWRSWFSRRQRAKAYHQAVSSLEAVDMPEDHRSQVSSWVAGPEQPPAYAPPATPPPAHSGYWQQPQAPATDAGYAAPADNWQSVPAWPEYPPDNAVQPPYNADYAQQSGLPPQIQDASFSPAPPLTQAPAVNTGFLRRVPPAQVYPRPHQPEDAYDSWTPPVPNARPASYDPVETMPYPSERIAGQAAENSVRRRRTQQKRRRSVGNLLSNIREKISYADEDQTPINELPPPVSQREAFYDPVYPVAYRYQQEPREQEGPADQR